MNSNKLFLRWIAVFGMVMIFAVSGWGDTSTNDSCSNAEAVTLNYTSSGASTTANTDRTDYYSFTPSVSGSLTAKVTNSSRDLDMYLYNSDCTLELKKDNSAGDNPSFSYFVTAGVTYKIRLFNDENRNTTYTLSLSLPVSPTTDTDGGREFSLRKNLKTYGDVTVIGNTVLCNPGGATCDETPNDYSNADVDLQYASQSYSTLAFPSNVNGSHVKWARLYWQGRLDDGTSWNAARKSSAKSISLKTPVLNTATAVSGALADFIEYSSGEDYAIYSAYADVTALVQAGGAGRYSVSNLYTQTGDSSDGLGYYGAWTLVVMYEIPGSTQLKDLSVFDGFKRVTSSDESVKITVGGFYTPSGGSVNSKVYTFSGEGDKYITGDTMKMGGINFNTVLQDISKVTDNDFNSRIDVNGTRWPNLTNNNGIDIHEYNVGTTSGGKNIITNGEVGAQFELTTSGDHYFPSLIVFSTDLYTPNVCYQEKVYKDGIDISGIGKQVNEDDNLTIRVLVVNTDNEEAQKVQVIHQFDTNFPYVSESSYVNNNNPTSITDGTGVKLYDGNTTVAQQDLLYYNTTNKEYKINLGVSASVHQGGDFLDNNGTRAWFEYKGTVKSLDNNYTNSYKASYVNQTLGLDFSQNPINIYSCDGSKNSFWGYRAPQTTTGDFNVVYAYHTNAALTSGYSYNLPTQITSRVDNYKVIALKSGTDILNDVNTTVSVQLVDGDSATLCQDMQPLSNRVSVVFDNHNETDLNAGIIAKNYGFDNPANTTVDEEFYQKAGKNIWFRISYSATNADGDLVKTTVIQSGQHAGNIAINNFTALAQGLEGYNDDLPPSDRNKCTVPVVRGNQTYNTMPTACGNASGTNGISLEQLSICMECVYGVNQQTFCSKDNFSIRPEAFALKLYDQNQTNSATKQFMMNNTPSPANKNMASGYRYYLDVNATNHLGTASSLDYNTTEDVDFVWNSTKAGCNDDTNKSISFSFANGLADGNVSVDQVGEYRLRILDTAWTAVDSNTSLMTHHTSPYFIVGTPDCTANSAVSSAVGSGTLNGCNIDTNHTNNVAGVTYTDSDVTFHPYKFDMTTVNFGVGILPQEINASVGSNRDFVYMSDMSRTDSMNMSVRATGVISARGENNSTLSNFVDNCYAVNTNLLMNTYNNITLANTDYQVRFVDLNGSGTVYDSNATNIATGALAMTLMTLDDGNFTKDMSGSLNSVTRLNYDRNQTTPLNPMTVQYNSLGFKCVTASECTMQANLSGSYEANGSRAMDFNVTHVYGRIIPRDVRVFGAVPFVANAWYEAYNMPTLNGVSLEASKNDAMWYVNNGHIDGNDGDGNVTVIIPTTPLNLPTHSSSTVGMETYQFAAIPLANIPYGGKAHINTDPWLWFGTNALGYLDPDSTANLDCLTHPCFNITVVPSIGATGSAKGGSEDKKASKKSDSEVGASGWKSTSDYAPAIR